MATDESSRNKKFKKNDECDYLIIGGGATGMAFSDTLLTNSKTPLKVIMVDHHNTPGGQWNDSYEFVQLHQPSSMYGVESKKLELSPDHRATRVEILQYYADVQEELETKYEFEFLGDTTIDLAQLIENGNDNTNTTNNYTIKKRTTGISRTIHVRKRIVDARNLEPDLPVSTPPKFTFSDKISVAPVNDIVNISVDDKGNNKLKQKHFVVVGGGKTGMDAISHLLTKKDVSLENLLWIVPNDAWITAREKIGNCIDLLYTCSKLQASDDKEGDNDSDKTKKEIGSEFLQRGFHEWEKQGHIYRIDPSIVPTKFKDATLSLKELKTLQNTVPRKLFNGRVSEITDKGNMIFQDGSTIELPFPVEDTLFIHCSAGAFHFTKGNKSPPPIFDNNTIVIQDVYGTPGFCFVGSMLGKLESMTHLSDDERNAMTLTPKPSPSTSPLGPSGGDVVTTIGRDHVFVQRARNLNKWLQYPALRKWMFQSRLFHLADSDAKTVSDKVNYIFKVLNENGILMD
mmetsp:Transcript_9653/g.11137  ORF Transcript_9653/g.11137 Transcript_9653/m.11137 type:complete len:514 (+) Transcript_9653:24-1565(+)